MKKFAAILVLFLFGLISCSEDPTLEKPSENPSENPSDPTTVTVEFSVDQLNLTESSGAENITISLSKPSETDGTITINATSANFNNFSTAPAIENGTLQLPIEEGQSSVSFEIDPVDNQLLDGNKSIQFTVTSVSAGFAIGKTKSITATLIDDEATATVNFMLNTGSTHENSLEGNTVIIALSHASPGAGSVEVSFTSDHATYGEHFTTIPAASNGLISLAVEAGTDHLELKVIPVNNLTISGDRTIDFSITDALGAVQKGEGLDHTFTISDDELAGISKSYSITAGSWSYKKYFSYRQDGQVSKVYWEQHTPGYLGGTYIYDYNASAQLVKMTESDYTETLYSWENGKITKTEKFTDGVLKQYTLYGYDEAGNVGEAAVFYRQPSGELKMGLLFVYLYYMDGNLYKQLTYSPVEGSEEYNLISTRTYENYFQNENPFPVEILPNVNSQPKLPGTYRVEENGHNILYQFFYEFDANGRPVKRTASSSAGSETAYYEYF